MDDEARLEQRQLGWTIAAALAEGPQSILVVSPRDIDARTAVARAIQQELALVRPEGVALATADEVGQQGGTERSGSLVVAGPPLLEGAALLQLGRAWMSQFDMCVMVCSKDKTRLRDLARADERLSAMGLKAMGAVWWRSRPPARRGPLAYLRRAVLSRVRRRPRSTEVLAHDG
jgi:hypothetical protein